MKRCLIFGGNGFLGFETLLKMIDSCHDVEVVIANRGRSWQWGKRTFLESRFPGPRLRIFKVDRKKPIAQAEELMTYLRSIEGVDFVIDFSAYSKYAVEQVIDTDELQRKIGHYIYISTDSVYEVCAVRTDGNATRESDAVRPSCPKKRRKYDKKDRYGQKKLECEEVLQTQRSNGGFAYTILRLADVIGLRDSTNRWLEYQLWLKLAHALKQPMFIPKGIVDKQISLVYCKDVAALITNLMTNENLRLTAVDEVFNIAFTENITMKSVLKEISRCLDIPHVHVSISTKAPLMYPSVDKGPIDSAKAGSLIGWQPTSFDEACRQTVRDFKVCLDTGQGKEEMWEAAEQLLGDVGDLYDNVVIKRMKELLLSWIKH